MSEETTQNISDPRSFEERVLALLGSMNSRLDSMESRLDSMESRLDSMDTRLKTLEEQSERRAIETKPIWERALAEILEVKEKVSKLDEKVSNVERKFDVLTLDMMQLRGDQRRLNDRMDKLESKPV